MKLRNKKTGEIWDIGKVLSNEYPSYDSLENICKYFEDIPKEPLIKDEKIRKAVRAWADASGITKVLSYGDIFWLGFRSVNTESVWKFECSYTDTEEFKLDKEYTIAELCGEEKE